MNTRRTFFATLTGWFTAIVYGSPNRDVLGDVAYANFPQKYTVAEIVNAIQMQLNDFYAEHGTVRVQLHGFDGVNGADSTVGVGTILDDNGMPLFSHQKQLDGEVDRFVRHLLNRPNRVSMSAEPTFTEWRNGKL